MMRFKQLRCSFCRKKDSQVAKLVAGPRVYICDACVAIATKIMNGPPSDDNARRVQHSMWRKVSPMGTSAGEGGSPLPVGGTCRTVDWGFPSLVSWRRVPHWMAPRSFPGVVRAQSSDQFPGIWLHAGWRGSPGGRTARIVAIAGGEILPGQGQRHLPSIPT